MMNHLEPEDAILEWVTDIPESVAIFEKHGLDYCCGGKSLSYACEQQGVVPSVVVAEIKDTLAARKTEQSE